MVFVMKKGITHIFASALTVLFAGVLHAQEIPVLPADPAVTSGVLPNGMSYYIASNGSEKGFADFALVQRTGLGTVPDSLSYMVGDAAYGALDSLPHFKGTSPVKFLARHGCGPGPEGFVSVSEDATVYNFRDVMLSCDSVTDSLLLMIIDIVDRSRSDDGFFMREWYAPSDQAVIVSGDVDAGKVAEKLRMLSYVCTSGTSLPRPEYMWEDRPEVEFMASDTISGNIAEVSLTWRSPRTPKEYMNTVQPVIYDIALDELALIARDRIMAEMSERNIPVADVSCVRYGGLSGPADEHFRVSASVAAEDVRGALGTLSSCMSVLDADGASRGEFRTAGKICLDMLEEDASAPLKWNRDYVDRCVWAFLYNGTLASAKEKRAFHASRSVHDTTMLRLFNGISSALLGGKGNLTVKADGMAENELKHVFDSAWHSAPHHDWRKVYSPDPADTVSLPGIGPKVKIKSIKKEHTSGGEIWTFTNGFRVIYKKMPSNGDMYYMMAMNGGYGEVDGLGRGEGAFMSDYPQLCYISGLKGRDFKKLLRSLDMTMDTRVNPTNTMVSGKVPKKRMQLLMRSLLAFSNERRPDSTAFSYYVKSEKLRLDMTRRSGADVAAAIDSLTCPDYDYSPYKSASNLDIGIADKAESLFASLSSKMNDGVLILVGDMDETALKKMLSMYVGGFRTRDIAFRRPSVRYQPLSGWLTYTVDGPRDGMVVAMSSRLPMTAENNLAAPVAAMALWKGLTEAFAGTGVSSEVSYSCGIYPEERFSVMISLSPAPGSSPMALIGTVRSVLAGLSQECIPEEDMSIYKAYVKNCLALEMSAPDYWRYAIALRYLEGKDFSTGYDVKTDALSSEKIRQIISLLEKGTKVEYIVKGK